MMKYTNSGIRRQDRLLDEERAYALLEQGEYGVLSMVAPTGEAYGVPVNYVWDGGEYLYSHGAPQGRKLDCLAYCPEVSFCVVGNTRVIPDKFTTAYESVVLKCRAETDLTEEERMRALDLLLRKYSPNDRVVGLKYAGKSFHRTGVIRLSVLEFSGKCKRLSESL